VVITGGGTGLTYLPNAGFCTAVGASDDFTYTLAPGGSSATVRLTVGCLSATVAPDPDVVASGTLGQPIDRSYTVSNSGPAFTGRLVGSPLASAKIARPTIADGAQQQFQVNVPAGTTSLRALIGNFSDADADLDLFLYNCSTGTCVLAAQSAGYGPKESVTLDSPATGIWIVLVDGYAVPSGTAQYDYLDELVGPGYGQLSFTDVNASRSAGGHWTVPGVITPSAAPSPGRVLRATASVLTSRGTTIGSGVVVVQSVS
jgi:hypothetical protein